MKTVLPMIILSCVFWPLQCMDTSGSQRIYPLVPVLQSSRANTDEQALLLTHDFLDKDRQTFALPSYQELYIGKEESEHELLKLQTLLEKKESELSTLPKKLDAKLRELVQIRTRENRYSQATVGGVAFIFYFTNMWLAYNGDPREVINGGWNESAIPCIDNLLGWIGSFFYGGYNFCKNIENHED